MWPALMLAASRKERVMGRRHILMVSINTKKGFNQSGAPAGRRWAAKDEGDHVIEVRIRESHKGRPKVRVIRRWLVGLKT